MSDTATTGHACHMTGTFFHAVDAKGRINFPAKLREQLGESFWLSRGTSDRCLTVYSREGWEAFMLQISDKRGPAAEKLRRWICSGAVEVNPDKQGRILIPSHLRMYAGLETDSEVAVIGAGRKAEIWSKAAWTEANDSFDPAEAEDILNELCL